MFPFKVCQQGYAKLLFYEFTASLMGDLVEPFCVLRKKEVLLIEIYEVTMSLRTRQMPQPYVSLTSILHLSHSIPAITPGVLILLIGGICLLNYLYPKCTSCIGDFVQQKDTQKSVNEYTESVSMKITTSLMEG